MKKPALTDHPVHPLIADRWSPRAFAVQQVEDGTLRSLFEAARWAPSCFNEQPWRFIVATRQERMEHHRLAGCLAQSNRIWAQRAPVLMLGMCVDRFSRDGRPNPHARHDLGLAVAQLTLQATSMGLVVHQLGGILPARIQEEYRLPEGVDAVTGLAIGYPGDPQQLATELRRREASPRVRMRQEEFVFTGGWEQPR